MATGAIFRRQFVCNKQGFKKLDDKRLNENEKRRRDLRTGYEAMIQVTLSKKLRMWVIDKFQDVHNHPLTTPPSKVIKHHSRIYNRRNAEEDEDFKTMTSKAVLSSDHPIERKAGDCYTRRILPQGSLDYMTSRYHRREEATAID
ncbi:hypothetical protein RJ640_005291 [Escallonia rubra]|uniref:FAR1 domain-containing protein n=1 Tax=Escallonia rubra TaxID=112253 RepID=A0AA88TY05_9ASTE|nr:hypothetical protein RJ640_005291 [Escallonia rubra]